MVIGLGWSVPELSALLCLWNPQPMVFGVELLSSRHPLLSPAPSLTSASLFRDFQEQ